MMLPSTVPLAPWRPFGGSGGHRPEGRNRRVRCAPGRTRTCDPLLRRQPLYPLSYRGGTYTLTCGFVPIWARIRVHSASFIGNIRPMSEAVTTPRVGDLAGLVPSWAQSLPATNRSPKTLTTYLGAAKQMTAFPAAKGCRRTRPRSGGSTVEAFIEDVLAGRKLSAGSPGASAKRRRRGWRAIALTRCRLKRSSCRRRELRANRARHGLGSNVGAR